jgi:hypothetical protein
MKTQLSKLDQVKKVLGMNIELAEMKLEDGVTVIEAEIFEAGQTVAAVSDDDQRIPLIEGEYKLEDGKILVVKEEGVIAEIKEETAEEEAPATEEPAEEVAASEAPTQAPVAKKVVESVSKETHFSAEEKEALENEITELKAQIAELSKVEKEEETQEEEVELAKAITPNPESKEEVKLTRLAPNKKAGISSRVLSHINKFK